MASSNPERKPSKPDSELTHTASKTRQQIITNPIATAATHGAVFLGGVRVGIGAGLGKVLEGGFDSMGIGCSLHQIIHLL